MNIKKITALTLAISVAALSGCAVKTRQDEEQITSIPEQFIESFTSGDDDTLDDLVEGGDARRYLEFLLDLDADNHDIIIHAISLTEIEDVEILEIDKREGTARAKVTMSYIDIDDFVASMVGTQNPFFSQTLYTSDEYIEALDSFDKDEKTMNLNFSYDERDEAWVLNKTSARRLIKVFASLMGQFIVPVRTTPGQAEELAITAFNELASSAGTSFIDLGLTDLRVYDHMFSAQQGPESDAAAAEFVEAYMTYIMEHNAQFEADGYDIYVTGSAPSTDYLCEQLNSREFLINYYMNYIRCSNPDADMEQILDSQAALLYNTLAQAIPDADPEPYALDFMYDPYSNDPGIWLSDSLIIEPDEDAFGPSEDMIQSCTEAAIERLYSAGEITQEQYDSLINNLTSDPSFENPNHPNQAVDTYEEVPSWCEDNSIVYGYSSPDENGFYMHYSKEPGVLNTVGYCFEDDGLYITNYYDLTFNVGDSFEVDWWIDGDQIVDAQILHVTEPFTHEVEVFLPADEYDEDSYIEMRLWEPGHNHVISYVILTR